MSSKIPPHSLEAEQAILGGLMLDSECLDQVMDLIEGNHFYKPSHQKIYDSIRELHNHSQPVDIITVTNNLQSKNELELAGGPEYLVSLLSNVISSVNILSYSKIVKEKSLLRRLISMSTGFIEKAYASEFSTVESFIDSAETDLYRLGESQQTSGLVSSMEIVKTSIETIEELYRRKADVTGIPTGFSDLDKMTSGLHPGELSIIAARPSMGKTAFSLNLATHMSIRQKKTVAYFSLEMSKESMMMRMLASEARVNMSDIRSGKINDNSWPKLIAAAGELSEADLYIDETPGLSPFEVRARARRLKSQKGLDCIMIDYIQLMSLKQRVDSREREVAEISKSLKAIAKELKIPVIALAQLNRGVEGRADRRPMLSDLRESGSIEQDADIIMMLYRDDYYDKEDPEKQGHAEVIIGKQRNGATGTVKLHFDAKFNRFRDVESSNQSHSNNSTAPPPQAPPAHMMAPTSKPRNFAPQ